jgi:hypothetical protein
MTKEVKLPISVSFDPSGIKQATRGANEAHKTIQKLSEEQNRTMAQIDQRGRTILKAAGLGAQMMGFGSTGYSMRMASVAGVGTKTVGSMGTASLLAAGAALGGIVLASKLVEVGLEALSSVVTSTAGAFIGAITTMGGARTLQQDIEAVGTRQDMSAAAQYTVGADERATQRQINKWASANAENPNLGGFNNEEWTKALNAVGTRSSKQLSFMADQAASTFVAHFALLTRDAEGKPDLTRAANLYAMFSKQNPNKSSTEIQDIILAGAGIAQHGAFTAEELTKHPDLLSQTAGMGIDRAEAYKQVFGLTSIFAPEKGVGGANNAITALKRGIFNSSKKGLQYSKDAMQGGQLMNLDVASAEFAAITPQNFMNMPGRGNVQSMEARNILRQHAGVELGDTFEEAKKKILDYIHAEEEGSMTQKDLNDSTKDTITLTSRLHTAFNVVNNALSTQVGPSLEALSDKIANTIKELKPEQIKSFLDKAELAFLDLVPIIVSVAKTFEWLGAGLVKTFGWLISHSKGLDYHSKTVAIEALEADVQEDKEALTNSVLSPEDRIKITQDMKDKNKEIMKLNTDRMNDLDVIGATDNLYGNVDKATDVAGKAQQELLDWSKKRREDIINPKPEEKEPTKVTVNQARENGDKEPHAKLPQHGRESAHIMTSDEKLMRELIHEAKKANIKEPVPPSRSTDG